MNKDLLYTLVLAVSFLALFAIAEYLYHFLKVKVELTRKLVHIGTGMLTLLFPVLLGNHWLVLLLCASFAVILLLSLKYNLLKSINAIDRESAGSIVYPVSVYGCYLAFDFFNQQYIYYYLPILIVAVCDPIAALAGKKWPAGKYKAGKENKTLIGSAMFFITSLVITWAMLKLEGEKTATIFFYGLFIAFVSTISEALSRKGYDNITIPVSVLLALVVMEKIF